MKIVRATRRHVDRVAVLMATSPLLRRYRVTAQGAKASLREGLRERDTILVAVQDEAVVGLAWFVRTRALDRTAYLRLLLVAKPQRSRGLGASLLARGERDARLSGSRHVVMLVTKTNRRARSFYERKGYTHVADLPGFVQAGIAESLYLKSWRA